MLTEFANKPAHVFKNPTEEMKARRQVIIDYCRNLLLILSPLSLKAQVCVCLSVCPVHLPVCYVLCDSCSNVTTLYINFSISFQLPGKC